MELSPRQQGIILLLIERGPLQSSEIHAGMLKNSVKVSAVTIKRTLSELTGLGLLQISGAGRSIAYKVSAFGRLFADLDARAYCAVEPDQRYGLKQYNFDLFAAMPSKIFSEDERAALDEATAEYARRTENLPPAIQKKELERLMIELSWKSSRIEGNTYTLLDTEKLILEHKEASGHDHREARMILNHKDAFAFVRENAVKFRSLTRANLEELHAILVKDLSVGLGLRSRPVGVLGSVYQPLDNIYQIQEVIVSLSEAVTRQITPYAKALVALLGLSYLQPFEDGNKRTSRIMANALLLAHGCAPLSYRSVEEREYREAMLVFYEINSLMAFKKIFIDQYEFAARNYAAK